MPKYLLAANYVGEGLKGLLNESDSGRRKVIEEVKAIEKVVKSAGGSVEGIYNAFGETDIYVIVDLPDNADMADLSLVINDSGAATAKTVVLMPPEEGGEATKKTIDYRPPGQ